MKNRIFGGALALPVILCAVPAAAQSTVDDTDGATIFAIGERPSDHGPAGIMAGHTHNGGEVMVGLEWIHSDFGGASNRSGTEAISDADIVAAGYMARTQSMQMDMAMLHIMYAPSDRVTLYAMPMWMRMKMTMVGIGADMPDDGGMGGHDGHHMLAPGETMTHSTQGIGDTEVGALVALSKAPKLGVIAGLGVSAPTGKVDRKDQDGNFVHYGMQSGSGTWDLVPSLTVKGMSAGFSWGSQAKYRFRAEDENESGFRFGDIFTANAWGAVPLGRMFSLSGRLGYSDEGKVEGHYNAGHNHASPPDRQANYGGRLVDAGIGANIAIGSRWQAGVEANVPLYQDLNGIQAPKRWGANLSISTLF